MCDRRALSSLVGLAALLMVPVLASSARADETFTYYQSAFLPTAVTITVGETIHWQWAAGAHTVTSGFSSDPDDNPGELFDVLLDEEHPLFSYTFLLPGVYSFFCRDHETGLVGTIIVEPFNVNVGVVNNSFTPEDVAIFVGDQVTWEWIEGEHTVTSGASSDPADHPGELFDETIDQAQPIVCYQFLEPGLLPYFCRPHEIFDMFGSVQVQRLFLRGDTNADGGVDVADAIALLDHLFQQQPAPSCRDAADANDSGLLDIADVVTILDYLFGGSVPLPPPFPSAGPDRTADALLCL